MNKAVKINLTDIHQEVNDAEEFLSRCIEKMGTFHELFKAIADADGGVDFKPDGFFRGFAIICEEILGDLCEANSHLISMQNETRFQSSTKEEGEKQKQ